MARGVSSGIKQSECRRYPPPSIATGIFAASPFAMTTTDTDFTLANYSVQVQRNTPGTFRYYFSASDGTNDAIGEPSWHRMPGPIVDGTASAQVSALSCCATALGAQVSFTLSADANVTAEVMNIAGRPVQVLATDKAMAAGINTLTWNGRSATGAQVPSGVYLVRVRAANQSGGQCEVLGSVMISR